MTPEQQTAEREYRKLRLDIAVRLYAKPDYRLSAEDAVHWADALIAANNKAPIP